MHSSAGQVGGAVRDMQAVEASITDAIYALEQKHYKRISEVEVSLSGVRTTSHYISGKIKLSDQAITVYDVKKLIQRILNGVHSENDAVIHYFPLEFKVDEVYSVINPVGMFGKVLSCNLHVITADTSLLFNITGCLAGCNLGVKGFVLSIYASALSCLTPEEQEVGALVIDMGADTTSMGILSGGRLVYADTLDIGSRHITSDIAKVFALSIGTAEKLKVLYGDASNRYIPEHDLALRIEDFEPDNKYNPNMTIRVGQLAKVIHSRIEEILTILKSRLEESCIDHKIARYVVLTGGGSLLKFIRETTQEILEQPVRLGEPLNFQYDLEKDSAPRYSTALGMLEHRIRKNAEKASQAFDSDSVDNWFKKLISDIMAYF
jgi:cell division protein FtsA